MKRLMIILLIFLALFAAGIYGVRQYLGVSQPTPKPGERVSLTPNQPTQPPTTEPIDFEIEVVATNLFVPWSIVFTGPERILVTERNGQLRQILNGKLQESPVKRFPDVADTGEAGLMSLVLHPNYQQNRFLYACETYQANGQLYDRVLRFTDQGESLVEDTLIIDQIPAAQFHAGCELGIGPDEKLYISTGDATEGELAQDQSSLAGKILRLNLDGSIPQGNPFSNSPIYSLGHRNPQGIAWHPVSGDLWSTEHGPSGFDGPGGGDEINLIQAGQNYGWPEVSHQESAPQFVDPKLVFTPAVAPASAIFYTGQRYPQFKNHLLFAMLRGEGIMLVEIDPDNPTQVLAYERLAEIDVGRVREINQSPDGFIYFTTSNRDGRGAERQGDDHLYRLIPTK